jgi:hypothetical protein
LLWTLAFARVTGKHELRRCYTTTEGYKMAMGVKGAEIDRSALI